MGNFFNLLVGAVSAFYPSLSSLSVLSSAIELGIKEHKESALRKKMSELSLQSISGSHFFLMEIWKRGVHDYKLLGVKRQSVDGSLYIPIWGEEPRKLPWYEQV